MALYPQPQPRPSPHPSPNLLQLVLFALHSSADCVPGVGGCRAALANGRVDAYTVKFIPQAYHSYRSRHPCL